MSTSRSTADRISALFREFRDDDDNDANLFAPTVEYPYSVTNVTLESRRVVYSTKLNSAFRVFEKPIAARQVTLLGRYGLPDDRDIEWILKTINGRECTFIGDADPQDVLVFAWLRCHVHVSWTGVSDKFLESMRTRLTDNLTIALSRIEREAARQIPALCPDFQDLLGANCGLLFDQGRKLELEGALNFATLNSEEWFAP